jgi:hypothetical protein
MKTIKLLLLANFAILLLSCSKKDDSCNEIVCGTPGSAVVGKFYIYRGTLNPDTCGTIELEVNEATFNYYQAKWRQNPEGYCCWEGLK